MKMNVHQMLVGPDGQLAQRYTFGRRLYAMVGWMVSRMLALFLALTFASLLVLCFPAAPWVTAAAEIRHRVLTAEK